jgi:hypothetical protein
MRKVNNNTQTSALTSLIAEVALPLTPEFLVWLADAVEFTQVKKDKEPKFFLNEDGVKTGVRDYRTRDLYAAVFPKLAEAARLGCQTHNDYVRVVVNSLKPYCGRADRNWQAAYNASRSLELLTTRLFWSCRKAMTYKSSLKQLDNALADLPDVSSRFDMSKLFPTAEEAPMAGLGKTGLGANGEHLEFVEEVQDVGAEMPICPITDPDEVREMFDSLYKVFGYLYMVVEQARGLTLPIMAEGDRRKGTYRRTDDLDVALAWAELSIARLNSQRVREQIVSLDAAIAGLGA